MTLAAPAALGAPAETREAATYRKIAWRLMPLIMVCYLFAFFDRINISFAKFQLQSDLGFSNTAYGLGASLFVVGYVIFEVPSNLILYRVGARRWIARIMISWGLATAAMVFITQEWHFYALRFLIGAMEAGFAPGILYYLTLWFPASRRGRITSMLFVASAFSGIVGAPVSGLILSSLNGVAGLAGWQWLFLAGGLPCLLLGALVMRRFDDRVTDARWLTDSEKSLVASQIAEANRGIGDHSLLGAIRSPGFLKVGLIYFLLQIGSYGLNFWGPDLIRTASGASTGLVGLLAALPYICGAISMVVIGRLSDASGNRPKFVAGLAIAAALGFFAAGLFDRQIVPLMLALCLVGTGIVASIPTFWTLPPKLVTGVGAAGGIALINTLGQFGGIVSPVMVGWVKDLTGSTTPAIWVIAGLCLAAAAISLFALPAQLRRSDRID
ncbi:MULTISPECIES: MFS transporter [unclassified Methylobacterium]|uniref:MFS transporter n=1 Tax=unclassified Methylobacterium TaxID=2615210 RepID=UPI0006FACAE0|nr:MULTISPECIES: MFS transporter [unclassified Methylobacterium]KQO78749.1 MFS transporter permease [Methylobacterium sp. Leaf88]KQP67349.1 MFS transporter permease [Methylobacterium sp. Leaf111]KQU27332.1 MFS transporter permease [Methylobacterium sp. Leaf94]